MSIELQKLDYIIVYVSNMQRSTAFYRDVLGSATEIHLARLDGIYHWQHHYRIAHGGRSNRTGAG